MRCKDHNRVVGGSRTSSHLTGYAVDIHVKSNRDRFTILSSLLQAGFTRLGVNERFIHVDTDTKTKDLLWLY